MSTPAKRTPESASSAEQCEGAEGEIPRTPEEFIDMYTEIWQRFGDASAQLATKVTNVWWNALPVARPEGLNMAGLAGVMAARAAKLGPEGDPLESALLALIAYAHGAHGQAMNELQEIAELRAELCSDDTDENDS